MVRTDEAPGGVARVDLAPEVLPGAMGVDIEGTPETGWASSPWDSRQANPIPKARMQALKR
jgi:hypothetical protein